MSDSSSEWSEEFWLMMRNRMRVSRAKYGPIKEAYPHKVDALQSMQQRVDKYHETGNREWLIDAANFLMIEFMLPRHPRAHFRATGSEESPGRTTDSEGITDKDNGSLA